MCNVHIILRKDADAHNQRLWYKCNAYTSTHIHTHRKTNTHLDVAKQHLASELHAPLLSAPDHSHTHEHTRTHTYKHTSTHTHSFQYLVNGDPRIICVCVYVCVYLCVCVRLCTRTHTRAHAHAQIYTHTRTHIHTHSKTHTCTHTHTHTHANTHIQTHTNTHTHTHTHTMSRILHLAREPSRFLTSITRCTEASPTKLRAVIVKTYLYVHESCIT